MDDQNLDDILRQDIDAEINRQIYRCFKIYGAEGTLEKIEELYLNMPQLKEMWLKEYWKIVRG